MSNSSAVGRFDFGGSSLPSSGTSTIKELLAELNQERELAEKSNTSGKAANGVLVGINSLTTTLNGIERITGRKIPKSEISPVAVSDLKTVKRLYLTGLEHGVKVFTIIDPPHLREDKWTLEFRESVPAPRNKTAAFAIQDLLTRLGTDVPSVRRETIERALPQLSDLLLRIEGENTQIGRILKLGFGDDMDAVTPAYQELTAWVDAYPVTPDASSNRLDEAIYTYLRTLRFAHFALGFKKAFELAEIKDAIEPIADHMDLLAYAVSKRVGQPLQLATPFLAIDQFDSFVDDWEDQLSRAITSATGFPVAPGDIADLSEAAKRVLILYGSFELGKRDTESSILSIWDCVSALCTIRHQQEADTRHAAYWPSQPTQGDVILRQLLPSLRDKKKPRGYRSIEDLFTEDYVPHVINQIIYQRFCNMQSALLGLAEVHTARMSFRVARLTKLAEIFRMTDVDQIVYSYEAFLSSLEQTANQINSSIRSAKFFATLDKWLHGRPDEPQG